MKTSFYFIIAILISVYPLKKCSAQNLYTDAWKEIDKGNFEKASELFLKDAEENKNPDAYLSLAYLEEVRTSDDESWEFYKKALEILDHKEYYLIASMQSMRIYNKLIQLDKYLTDFLYNMTENKEDGFIRNYSRERLGYHLQNSAHLEEALMLFKGMNVVRKWSVIGPFNNISQSGFNIPYLPEKEFEKDKSYIGLDNSRVTWFDLKKTRNDGWIDFKNYLLSVNSIYYANNFVYSSSRMKVQLRLGTSGSLKLFLNDQLLFENDEEANNNSDTYIVETFLQEGWNKVLLKTGFSEIDQCNFMFRITDVKGFDIEGLEFSTDKQPYNKTNDESVTIVKSVLEKYFEERLQKDSLNPVNYLLLGHIYNMNDKNYLVEKTYSAALEKFPDNVILAVYLYSFFDRKGNGVRANAVAEQIKSRKIEVPLITADQLRDNVTKDKKDNFLSIYESIKFEIPQSSKWAYYEILYRAYKNQANELYVLVDSAYSKYPFDESIVALKYVIEYNESRDINKPISRLEKFCSRVTTPEALKVLANLYMNASRMDDWEKIYNRILLHAPSNGEFYNEMSIVYNSARDYNKAVKYINQALEISPGQANYSYNLGQYNLGLDNTELSKQCYKKAIEQNPFHYEAIDALRNLEGAHPIESELPAFNIEDMVKEVAAGELNGNDAVYYLMDNKLKYYEGGANEIEVEILIKIINSSGVEDFSYTSIENDGGSEKLFIDKAVVIKPDGKEVKAEINDNEMVFNSLEVNDFIHYKYRIRYYYSSAISEHFYRSYYFSYYYPVKNIRYSLTAPASVNFYFSGNNMDGSPSFIKREGDKKLYVWEKNNIPEIDYEYGMPSLIDAGSILYITTLNDWNIISDWYYNVTRSKLKEHFVIKDKVNELLKETSEMSDIDKVKIVYNYIMDNITYVSVPFIQSAIIPRNADDILSDKVGDCKDMVTLFIAMLKETGIKADYVLVRTSSTGKALNAPPYFLFDHLIAVTYFNGEKQFYDLTATDYPCGVLPAMVKGAFALEITPEKVDPFIIDRKFSKPTIIDRITEVTLKDDNSAEIKIRTTRKGESIPWFLYDYKGLSYDKTVKTMTESFTGGFTNFTITDLKIDSSDIDNKINYNLSLKVNNHISKTGDYKLFKIPWISTINEDQGLVYDKRNYAYQIYYMIEEFSEEIKITLPGGYEPIELPENTNLSSSIADFSVSYSYKDGIITGKRMLKYKSDYLSPEDYQNHKELYNYILSVDASQVLLGDIKK